MSSKWYVIRTQARAESLAATELARDGFEIFFPVVKTTRLRSRRPFDIVFPGYLFLKCDTDADGWPLFRPAHRILGWLRFAEDTPWLSDAAIQGLRDRIESISNQGGLWQRFRPGEKVEVSGHSLEGLGEVIRDGRSPSARVEILLHFMGRTVKTQIPRENLQPVNVEIEENYRRRRGTRGRGRRIGYLPRASIN
jgi:transcriptional antiterminator RfaH